MKNKPPQRNEKSLMRRRSNGSTAHFALFDPAADEVFVAGTFNNWNPSAAPLLNTGHGRWVKELPLPSGRYEYQFIVDGRWIHDRASCEKVDNPFGGINSIIEVAHPQYRPTGLRVVAKRVNPKWSWHYHALTQLRDRLLEDRAEQMSEARQPLERHSMHFADSATDELDHERVANALDSEQGLLYEVEQAIQRILDGTYGRCQVTGKRIPSARLHAVPWTPFCKEAEEELERLRSAEAAPE